MPGYRLFELHAPFLIEAPARCLLAAVDFVALLRPRNLPYWDNRQDRIFRHDRFSTEARCSSAEGVIRWRLRRAEKVRKFRNGAQPSSL
jgi:hypothetical protein